MKTFARSIGLAALLSGASVCAGAETTLTLTSSIQGIFTSYGQNNKHFNTGPGNYLCGQLGGGLVLRNYFVFNLPSDLLDGGKTVQAAVLNVGTMFNHYLSVDASETYAIFHVQSSSYIDLLDVETPLWQRYEIFADLGEGSTYGSRTMTAADSPIPGPTFLPVVLDPAKITDELALRLQSGANNFAVGGAITTLIGNDRQACFGFSGYDPMWGGRPTLTLTFGTPSCAGDLNSDQMVDDSDFVLFAGAYNVLDCADPAMQASCPADLNSDGVVDDADFVVFAAAYDRLICP